MANIKEAIIRALNNIIHFGDTDVFPFPFERTMFRDNFDEVQDHLLVMHDKFSTYLEDSPPLTIVRLSQVGYYGFRRATLIEPFWNAYLLALVISIAKKIEKARIPISENRVFSYRFKDVSDDNSLFLDTNWLDYKRKCIENSKKYSYVLQTDISNFYDRINHHRLESELERVVGNADQCKRILKLLSKFSSTMSYGLPVGGPAARILAELSLISTDDHLRSKGIEFCRYADDYTIFCSSESEGYKHLIFLSDALSVDLLGLQKTKTKLMSSEEYQQLHRFLDPVGTTSEEQDEGQRLLNISIRYDPYSPTADEDYEALKDAINDVDIIGILSKEVQKSAIDQTVTKQAINAIKALPFSARSKAIRVLLDSENMSVLSPVFTTIMRLIRSIFEDLTTFDRKFVDDQLLHLFDSESYLVNIHMNVYYIIQVLSMEFSEEKEKQLVKIFDSKIADQFIKRMIIIAMANWDRRYFFKQLTHNGAFAQLTTWERRAVIYSSYQAGEVGKHWLNHNSKQFSPAERIVDKWISKRDNGGNIKSILV